MRIVPGLESCREVTVKVAECRLGSLSRAKAGLYRVEVTPRVITRQGRTLRKTIVRFALQPVGEPYDVELRFTRCSLNDPGAGGIVGTRWDDMICGRRGADRITGGSGRDTLQGGRGHDTVSSRDRARDVVRCGPGRDRVVADRRDSVAKDCERVLQR